MVGHRGSIFRHSVSAQDDTEVMGGFIIKKKAFRERIHHYVHDFKGQMVSYLSLFKNKSNLIPMLYQLS